MFTGNDATQLEDWLLDIKTTADSIMMEIAKIVKNNISLDILRQNIFPDRPEEAAMFGCESLST